MESWDRAGGAYRLREVRVVSRAPVRPTRKAAPRWLGGAAVLLRLGLAVAVAWVVLVALRRPAEGIDERLRDSLLADRTMTVAAWVANVAATLVLGGLAYRAFVRDPATEPDGRAERVLCSVALAGVAATVATLPLRAASLAGAWWVAFRRPSTLGFVVSSPFGDAALLRTAGLTAVAVAVWRHRGSRIVEPVACGLGAGAILASFTLVGHPQATGGRPSLLVLAQLVHIVAASVWFGGVTFLVLDLRRRRRAGDSRGVARVVGRFSTLATLAVVATAGTGACLAWSQLGELRALWVTAYGRAFLAKMGCVGLVAVAGGYNREMLVPALDRLEGPAVWQRLRRTMTLEMLVMGLGVLLATALMTSGGL